MKRRLRAFASWQVAAPILAYVLSALLVISVVEAFVARNEAVDTRNRTAAAAARRVDLLNAEITRLQNRLAADAGERGRLEEAIKILAEQVRRLGGQPVAPVPADNRGSTPRPAPGPSASPAASPRPTPRPTPHPTPTSTPSPHPTPSPTCNLQHLIDHPVSCLHP